MAESLRHFVPSHAVTYVSQGAPPDDDIVSVILLLYNPITKCPVHLHAYRCDSVETADLLAEQLQLLVDMPENQRKISELEQRLQSQGLYPNATGQLLGQSRMLIKSCDTGLGGSNGDLLADSSSSSEDPAGSAADQHAQHQRPALPLSASADPTVPKHDQERIARLYDSLAAELRDKLGGAVSGKSAPILLPPRDYEPQSPAANNNRANKGRAGGPSGNSKQTPGGENINGSSSGPSSGIGSDLDDHPQPKNHREAVRPTGKPDVMSQHPRQRYSYHEPQQQQSEVVRRRDPVVRQLSERREATLLNRRSMSDLRYRQEESSGGVHPLRWREESCRDVRDFQIGPHHSAMYPEGGRNRVKETLTKFEQKQPTVSASSRSRSFREIPDQASHGWSHSTKFRRQQQQQQQQQHYTVQYQELDERERFPGLDRETARVVEPLQHQRNLQRHKSSEFASLIKRSSVALNMDQATASLVVVEPTQKVGNRHFRAIRQPN